MLTVLSIKSKKEGFKQKTAETFNTMSLSVGEKKEFERRQLKKHTKVALKMITIAFIASNTSLLLILSLFSSVLSLEPSLSLDSLDEW